MEELKQAAAFFEALDIEKQEDMTDAIAEDIFFLDEKLQRDVIALMKKVAPKLGEGIERKNDFTL